eukprot:359185-Chlamydomonas_euryale.AAC.7
MRHNRRECGTTGACGIGSGTTTSTGTGSSSGTSSATIGSTSTMSPGPVAALPSHLSHTIGAPSAPTTLVCACACVQGLGQHGHPSMHVIFNHSLAPHTCPCVRPLVHRHVPRGRGGARRGGGDGAGRSGSWAGSDARAGTSAGTCFLFCMRRRRGAHVHGRSAPPPSFSTTRIARQTAPITTPHTAANDAANDHRRRRRAEPLRGGAAALQPPPKLPAPTPQVLFPVSHGSLLDPACSSGLSQSAHAPLPRPSSRPRPLLVPAMPSERARSLEASRRSKHSKAAVRTVPRRRGRNRRTTTLVISGPTPSPGMSVTVRVRPSPGLCTVVMSPRAALRGAADAAAPNVAEPNSASEAVAPARASSDPAALGNITAAAEGLVGRGWREERG